MVAEGAVAFFLELQMGPLSQGMKWLALKDRFLSEQILFLVAERKEAFRRKLFNRTG